MTAKENYYSRKLEMKLRTAGAANTMLVEEIEFIDTPAPLTVNEVTELEPKSEPVKVTSVPPAVPTVLDEETEIAEITGAK